MVMSRRARSAVHLASAVRSASRPGGPSLLQRLRAVPRMVRAVRAGTYTGLTSTRLLMMLAGVGYIVSSRLYHRFNDRVFITNDTDYLSSEDSDDVITNQFGVNFQMSEQLATRVSYTTEYQENRPIRTDNTLGVSVVYGF